MNHSLPNNLYSGEQVRQMDRLAMAQGVSGEVLMKRAGRAAFARACALWPENREWCVLCGKGNNAGDGYVFAALAAQRGHAVRVLYLADPQTLTGEARAAWQYAQQESVSIAPFDATMDPPSGSWVAVDALLGTGAVGRVREPFGEAIEWLNRCAAPVLALDLPSGLHADTGAELGCAVRASATVTFVALKLGLVTGRGPALTGSLWFDDLQVPQNLFAAFTPLAQHISHMPPMTLPERDADAHKGRFGRVAIVGGDHGMGGAAILAAEAAAYAGAGLVSVATRAEHVTAVLVRRPEIMALAVASGQTLAPHLALASLLVVGPGLGRSTWSEQLLQAALAAGKPMVLDADALNLLADGRLSLPTEGDWIITPHPGEAAHLLGTSTQDVQADRLAAARRLQTLCGGVVVLKGAGTIICDGATCVVAAVGNPGLATGGSGDVLCGLIAACWVQGLSPMAAATLAVCVHGHAADLAVADTGVRGLQAAELLPYARELLK